MLQLIGNTIECILGTIVATIGIVGKFGLLLSYVLKYVFDLSLCLVSSIAACCTIFYEELKRFAEEIDAHYIHGATAFHNVTVTSVAKILLVVTKTSTNVNNLAEAIRTSIQNGIQCTVNQLTWLMMCVSEFTILLGDSAWMLLMIIPNLLIFCSMKLAITIAAFVNGLIATIKSSAVMCIDGVVSFVICLTAMPMQSALGLLSIGIAIKYRRITLNAAFILLQMHLIVLSFVLTRVLRILLTIYQPLEFIATVMGSVLRLQHRSGHIVDPVNELASNAQDGLSGSKEDVSPIGDLCVICQDRRKSVVLLPCRHLCLCRICSTDLKKYHTICPLCRKSFREAIQVYV